MHFLLFYEKAPDHAEREPSWQAAHRDHVSAAARRGEVILAGSLADPSDGAAVLLFRAASSATPEAFATADPYVVHGIVTRWRVRRWELLVGDDAAAHDRDEADTK